MEEKENQKKVVEETPPMEWVNGLRAGQGARSSGSVALGAHPPPSLILISFFKKVTFSQNLFKFPVSVAVLCQNKCNVFTCGIITCIGGSEMKFLLSN